MQISMFAEETQLQRLSNLHKLAQKDTDAHWTKKNGETHYGYKDHVKVVTIH